MICRMDDLQRKEVISVRDGARIGTVGDAEVDTTDARLVSIIIYGRPRLFGLLGRDESLTIPWQEIETIGADAILVHTALPEAPPQPEKPAFWRKLLAKWGT